MRRATAERPRLRTWSCSADTGETFWTGQVRAKTATEAVKLARERCNDVAEGLGRSRTAPEKITTGVTVLP